MNKRLIAFDIDADRKTFTGYLAYIAYNIEDSFVLCGAKPKQDYTLKDLFELATPYVLAKFADQDPLAMSYPAPDNDSCE